MKILLITTCAPFKGEKDIIQRRALRSWKEQKDTSVIVLGNDYGSDEICKEYGFQHIANIPTANDNLKLKHYAIMLDEGLKAVLPYIEDNDVIVWANSDLVFDNIYHPFYCLWGMYKGFVGWCRRWDYDWKEIKDIDNIDMSRIQEHPYCGIDVFFWTKEFFYKQVKEIPNFVVDAWQTDHYFKRYMGSLTRNYIELTYRLKAIHLNHSKGVQLTGDWNIAAKHNRELFSKYTPVETRKPFILR